MVSQAFPLLRTTVGLGGVFGIFSVMGLLSWAFVFIHVPETKGTVLVPALSMQMAALTVYNTPQWTSI